MTPEFGVFFLILALLIALLQSSHLLRAPVAASMPVAAWLQALCITAALAILITLRLDSDFSVTNVIAHSNLSLPTLYKITGAWGNHEGSMLLWVWVLAMFGAALSAHRDAIAHAAIAVQSVLCAGFLAFILCTSNPFARQFPPTVDGQALNPLLQDIALAIHPPLLYLGYVGFSIVFSLAVAALLCGRADRTWAEKTHPWIMASWSALTLGIGLGSWWAYRELGWGGWWFWDPVENASLLPWLSGTALLHSNIVLKKRGLLAQWVLLLSIVTFALSLLGTFLVRSGALTSVHSFASDPARGLFILAYIAISVGGALLLYAFRAPAIIDEGRVLPASREGMIVLNNLFLLTACASVLLGTLYPLFAEWLGGERLTVGPPFFNATFLPLIAIALLFAALTPFMPWKKASPGEALAAARPALLAAIAAAALTLAFAHTRAAAGAAGFALAAWLGVASLQWLLSARAANRHSVFLAHAGAAVLVAGITASSLWKEETERWVRPGDTLDIGGYHVTYTGSHPVTGPNYKATQAELILSPGLTLTPQYRTYDIRATGTSETAIHYGLRGDLYSVIGDTSPEGKTALRLYWQPMISLIWLGFVLMTIGGIVAIIQKKSQGTKNVTL